MTCLMEWFLVKALLLRADLSPAATSGEQWLKKAGAMA